MNRNTKTALIVALSVFGAGVLIWLCVSLSIGFNYSKLSVATGGGSVAAADDPQFRAEHFEKLVSEKGQIIALNLSSADVTVTPSADDSIHLSYDSTENSYFEYVERDDEISLTQKQKSGTLSGLLVIGSAERIQVRLSLPAKREGDLRINGASSEISVSDIDMQDDMDIYGVSGDLTIQNCAASELNLGSVSGEIRVRAAKTGAIEAHSVSGDLHLSALDGGIPLTLGTTSGEVRLEDVKTTTLGISLVSGDVTLKNVSGKQAGIGSTSGSVRLDGADFLELDFSTVSGDISGTVTGKAEDYTVYTDTVSGNDSLSSHRGRGERTLDLSSTSGNFNIRFAG